MRLEAGHKPSSLCVFVCMCVSCLALSLNRSQGLTQHGSLVPVIGQDISLSVKKLWGLRPILDVLQMRV